MLILRLKNEGCHFFGRHWKIHITLIPIVSDFRDSETKEFKPTTDYFEVVEEFIKEIEYKEGIKHLYILDFIEGKPNQLRS